LFSMASGKTAKKPGREYATASDFCALFKTEANRFYFLCRLLLSDAAKAEQCFILSLETCLKSHRVFREWAQRWATHTIIKAAIQMNARNGVPAVHAPTPTGNRKADMLLSAMQSLTSVDRTVYVMSVLEGYSDQECATLVGITLRETKSARERALTHLSQNADLLSTMQPLALRMTS
jgi:DNA-directed RNA polymerase specialized sigma24 family protein